jgi:putative transposase
LKTTSLGHPKLQRLAHPAASLGFWFHRGRPGFIGPGIGRAILENRPLRMYNSKTAGSAQIAEPPLQRRLKLMRFRRKNIRLHPTRYRGRAWFFVTICCEEQARIFADSNKAQWLMEHLRRTAEKCHFAVHAFCAMPDHFHALVEGTIPESDLLLFVSIFKRATSLEYSGVSGSPLWQKKFYDHILRQNESPDAVAWYIWMNPVRKGLCSTPIEFPFSASFTERWEKRFPPHQTWIPPWIKDKSCPSKIGTASTKSGLP